MLLESDREEQGRDWRQELNAFIAETDRALDLLGGFMPEFQALSDAETLTYLHGTISPHRQRITMPETPLYLDTLLVDSPLSGGIAPMLGDALPPATVVEGSVTYMQRMALPQGAELRIQLLDTGKTPADIVAEQVVRSGWQVPIPFALRLPKDMSLDGRKLVVTARLVVRQQTLFELKAPRSVPTADLAKPLELTLEQPAAPAR